MLDALRSRDFRLLWSGLVVSNTGAWMQIFALGILVVQISAREGAPERAPLYLGLMGLARAVPGMVLTLLAGAVADRVDRRSVLLVTQTTMALNAGALAAVTFAGAANVPFILAASAIHSAAFAFDNPARQSMVPRIVPMRVLPSAIGLQSAAFNGASIVGPLLAGLLYIPIGVAGLLAVNSLSFLAILGALLAIPRLPPAVTHTRSLVSSVVEGARYVRRDHTLTWVLVISGSVFVAAGPAGAFFPAIAGETLYLGMSWLSLLLTATGLGAFCAAFAVMNIGRIRRPGRLFVAGAIANGVAIVIFALVSHPLATLLFALLAGFSGTLMAGMGNNMLQASTDDAYRGRVMSLWGLLFIGLMPIGQLVLGAIGTLLGVHAAFLVGGAIAAAAGVFAATRTSLRHWRTPRERPLLEGAPALSPAGATTLK